MRMDEDGAGGPDLCPTRISMNVCMHERTNEGINKRNKLADSLRMGPMDHKWTF